MLWELEDIYNLGVFDQLLSDTEVITDIIRSLIWDSIVIQLDEFIMKFVVKLYDKLWLWIVDNFGLSKKDWDEPKLSEISG